MIQNATVHTLGAQGTLQNTAVLIEDGIIVGFGDDLELPTDARYIDAAGGVITPGVFDPYSRLGVTEVDAVDGTVDGKQGGSRFTASFDVASAINPRSTLLPISRIEGITHAMVTAWPGKNANLMSGLGAVIHLGGADSYLVKRAAALFVQLGEKGGELAGQSRAAAMLGLRE
ncbi:MAG: amidohydrolase, partial [Gammaproteobacteria bacterium]|nr:amidohydrolase [Gammaproteobacteria bacterium]